MPPPREPASGPPTEPTLGEDHPGSRVASTDFDLVPEAPKALGEYELLEEIGAGGMGRVFKARQRSRDRVVALKTLQPRYLATPALVQRFRKEAESAAHLEHPGIVPVYKFDEAGGQF